MLKFKEFTQNGYLTIFDIDDTLFHTTAKIIIKRGDKVVKKITSAEYNTYQLGKGESVDFSEFSDAKKFYKESRPITKMLDKAKAILADTKKHPNNKVIIVTARPDLDDRETFLNTFKKYGFDINRVRVERAGKIKGLSAAQSKAIIIYNYLKTNR